MLNSRQLEAFRTVILSGGVNSAAKLLHISQPAVSRLIKELEAAVGFSLFQKEGRRLCATPEALNFFQEVQRSFVGLKQLGDVAKSIKDRRTKTLKICAIPALARNFLPSFLVKTYEKDTAVHIEVSAALSSEVLSRVVNGHSDVGILSLPLTHPDIAISPLPPLSVVAVLSPRHRLGKMSRLRPQDFQKENVVIPGRETALRLTADAIFTNHNIKYSHQFETPFTDITCAMVLAGAGLGLADPFSAREYKKLGILVRPFEPNIPLNYAFIHQSSRPPTEQASNFMRRFREHLDDFMSSKR